MLSARSLPSPDAAADIERTEARLRGTIWERRTLAHAFYRASLALGRGLGRIGLSANLLTYSSLVLAAAAGVAAGTGQFLWAAGLVLASGVCDVLDGIVARATKTCTPYGALLDSTVDRLADGLPLVGLVVLYRDAGLLAAIPAVAMLGGFTVSYVRARAEALGARLPPLFMRRAERVLLIALSLGLGAIAVPAPVVAPLALFGVTVIGALNFIAALVALRAAKRVLEATGQSASSAEHASD